MPAPFWAKPNILSGYKGEHQYFPLRLLYYFVFFSLSDSIKLVLGNKEIKYNINLLIF